MSYIEPIKPQDVSITDNIIYVGFDMNEVQNSITNYKSRKMETPFLGGHHDALFKAFTNLGEEYIVVFKALEHDVFMRPIGFLFLEEEGYLMVNANGRLYRFLVNEKTCLNMSDYDLPPTAEAKVYSLGSPKYKVMILATNEGLLTITWEKELWKKELEWAGSGYLELVEIKENHLYAEYYDPLNTPKSLLLVLDILTGELISKTEHKGRWYHFYFG